MEKSKFPVLENKQQVIEIASKISKIVSGVEGRDMSMEKYKITKEDIGEYLASKPRGPYGPKEPVDNILTIIQCINLYLEYLNNCD